MNNYKFRGKTADGKWAYGNIIEYGKECHIFEKENAEKDKNPLAHMPLVRPETVGQWTGYLDKNGAEIYEGDILKTWHHKYGIIKFENYGYVFKIFNFLGKPWKEKYSICQLNEIYRRDMKKHFSECVKIIGNIHDNPELLEDNNAE